MQMSHEVMSNKVASMAPPGLEAQIPMVRFDEKSQAATMGAPPVPLGPPPTASGTLATTPSQASTKQPVMLVNHKVATPRPHQRGLPEGDLEAHQRQEAGREGQERRRILGQEGEQIARPAGMRPMKTSESQKELVETLSKATGGD